MSLQELLNKKLFKVINTGSCLETVLTKPFCCDLLSSAMSKAPAGGVWITVIANMNTLAVASLTKVACIILAEGVTPDSQTLKKAREQQITVLASEQPIFETSLLIYELIQNDYKRSL
ncbi:hypothetical protein acsn021_01050 [Anaerocolumna cellulosilytica]|uniref:DRTGG domain-containing protein n=1 Tax=Anaerocolumna cellulosilytica TaxID=433286 RepID=A0A6S6QSD6_9FIRM|nr:DRTGG domain-containing protein [Anaerocolumna cellulosilytica]MBB5196145.1 hypothetical protein [Anaerocolumna cellulosilytica]BCJ92536.1 hypothetical protein acsn021_01050 [Anaerocolumna cellulosilytica]